MEKLFRPHDVGGPFGGLDEAENPAVSAPCGSSATTLSETEKHVSCGSSVPSPSALPMKELRDVLLKDLPHDHPSEAVALHKPPTSARKNSKMTKKPYPSVKSSTPARPLLSPPSDGSSAAVASYDACKGAPVANQPKKMTGEKMTGEKIGQRLRRMHQNNVETALRTYNKANNTNFELVEIKLFTPVTEPSAGYYHYNFTAKPKDSPKDSQSATGASKLFFAEVHMCLRDERDVVLCCILGKKERGHCNGCDYERSTRKTKHDMRKLRHPSSGGYLGGYDLCAFAWVSCSDSDEGWD